MIMYNLIPLKDFASNDLDLESHNCICIGLNTISKLLAYDNYPIKNKRIAIDNILTFLKAIDNIEDKNMYNITLHSKFLINHFTSKHYSKYMDIFNELKIMIKVPHKSGIFYKKGECTMQYGFYSEYLNDSLCILLMSDEKINLEIDNKTKYNNKLIRTLKRIEVDYEGAINAEIKNHKDNNTDLGALRKRLNMLLALNDKRYINTGNKVDRIYHSLSNISRISRKYLHINNKYFNNVDVKNCQPLLLCALITKLGLQYDDNYKYDCERGQLYENFIIDGYDRNETKVLMYRKIYFKFQPESTIAKRFKELYPLTYNALELISNNESIASQLQNLEAEIFNNIVPKNSEYYYPLFDSIYFTNIDDVGSIIIHIKDNFNKYGIKPILTINDEPELDIEDFCI